MHNVIFLLPRPISIPTRNCSEGKQIQKSIFSEKKSSFFGWKYHDVVSCMLAKLMRLHFQLKSHRSSQEVQILLGWGKTDQEKSQRKSGTKSLFPSYFHSYKPGPQEQSIGRKWIIVPGNYRQSIAGGTWPFSYNEWIRICDEYDECKEGVCCRYN